MVGPYQVQSVLGRGSFGVVLLADHPSHPNKQFALKLVPCDHFNADVAAKARADALAEAALLESLRHPNVVCCHSNGWDSRRRAVWFALDFMDGGDLQTYIDARRRSGEGPAEPYFCRQVLGSMGGALAYIHSQGVLHRDVKPSNMLLDSQMEEVKLADFGISKILEATGCAHTFIGTPYYLSPEIIRGAPYGAASDAWALGVCIYELAALHRPFQAENQLALARQIVDEAPVALPQKCAPDVARLILSLLEKEPKKRIQLANVVAALEGTTKKEVSRLLVPCNSDGSMTAAALGHPVSARSKVHANSTPDNETSGQGRRASDTERHVGWSQPMAKSVSFGHCDEVQVEISPDTPTLQPRLAEEWSVGSSLQTEELPTEEKSQTASATQSASGTTTTAIYIGKTQDSHLQVETPRDTGLGGTSSTVGKSHGLTAPRSPSTLASSSSNGKFSQRSFGRKWFRFGGCLPMDVTFNEEVAGCCNNGHNLQRFSAPQDTLKCNVCEQRISKGASVWGCLTCNFGLCQQCAHLEAASSEAPSDSTTASSGQTTKRWFFVLPGSGCHQVKAEYLGQRIGGPVVYINGIQAPPPANGVLQYVGPGDSILELRRRDEKRNHWDLFVNGIAVEDYSAGKRKAGATDSLHNLKGMPDGSYTIATHFSQEGKRFRPIRRFHFRVNGTVNEMEIAHSDCVWEVMLNGIVMHRRTHTYWDNRYESSLRAKSSQGDPIDVFISMEWDSWRTEWCYSIAVNNVDIPYSWARQTGHVQAVSMPEVQHQHLPQAPVRYVTPAPPGH